MGFGLSCLVALLVHASPPVRLPVPPGPGYAVGPVVTTTDGPLVYSHTTDAGPDESFVLVGERLTRDVVAWGPHAMSPRGRDHVARVQLLDEANGVLVATLPQEAADGPFVVRVRDGSASSAPVVLNAPEPWWCLPDVVGPGSTVRIFGRNLARRPHFATARVWLAGGGGRWLEPVRTSKYELEVLIPPDAQPGACRLWVHAGQGGEYGWGPGLPLTVERP
ncbi:MAG: hypothetical protein HY815_07410, partial [Candidatus Riflebacteria bacterium]|nr:hypothetical protein [Candidatus Riflebacteria bacterium]